MFKVKDIIRASANGIKARVVYVDYPSNIIQIEYINPSMKNYEGIFTYTLSEFNSHWYFDEESNKSLNNSANSKTEVNCFHEWSSYVGFTESYLFCKNCNQKKI